MNLKINDNVFNQFPKLETDRLLLDEFKISDAEELFNLRSDDRVMKYLDRDNHKSVKDSEEMIESIIKSYKDKTGLNWIIREKESEKVAGYIGYWRLIRESVRAEIGYALSPDFWGKGLMYETLIKIIKFGFTEFGLHSVEGNVNPNNIKSIKVLEKLRFRKEAHFREDYLYKGKFLDSAIYCFVETDYKT